MGEGRRRRADAERNVTAILDGAVRALRRRSDASVEDVAREAGVSRQTVYAHFSSREALLAAVLDHMTREVLADLERADAGAATATDALEHLLLASWRAFERYPFVPDLAPTTSRVDDEARHEPITDRLAAVLRRGRRTGEFDRDLPVAWIVNAVVALGHAAGRVAADGRMSSDAAVGALRVSVLRLVGADEAARPRR